MVHERCDAGTMGVSGKGMMPASGMGFGAGAFVDFPTCAIAAVDGATIAADRTMATGSRRRAGAKDFMVAVVVGLRPADQAVPALQ